VAYIYIYIYLYLYYIFESKDSSPVGRPHALAGSLARRPARRRRGAPRARARREGRRASRSASGRGRRSWGACGPGSRAGWPARPGAPGEQRATGDRQVQVGVMGLCIKGVSVEGYRVRDSGVRVKG